MKTTKTIWTISRLASITSIAAMAIAVPFVASLPAAAAPAASAPSGSSATSVIFHGQRVKFAPTSNSDPAGSSLQVPEMMADAGIGQQQPLISLPTTGPAVLPVSDTPTEPPIAPLPPATVPPPADTVTDKGSSVNLDFVDASIVDILKALAIQSGSNIVTSPDVTGKVTVTLSHVSLESALDYVTKMAGFEWLKNGNTYIIGTDKSLEVFRPTKVVSTERVTKTIEFQHSDPDDLISSIKSAFPDVNISLIKPGTDTTSVAAAGGSVTTTSSREKGGVLMVTGLIDTVKSVQDFVGLAENTFHPSAEDSETSTYRIKYAFGPNLITVLGSLVPKLTVITGPAQEFDSGQQVKFNSSSNNLSDRFTAPSAIKAGETTSGPDSSVDSKLTSPTLLILSGTREDVSRALDILSKIDVKPVQLLFEAKVTEIKDDDEKKLGMNWNFTGATTTIGETVPVGTSASIAQFPGQILKFGTIGRTPAQDLATVTMDALITDGKAKLLASPNVAALDGQRATVFIGDTINYIQSITQATTGENITTASVNVGVILSLTGRASDDGYITLYLHPEVSELTGYTQVPGGGELPQLAERFADTVIRVKDGDTIAIGGLIQDNYTDGVNKVPILGDLPVLGNFFRDIDKVKDRSEVIFFIKTSLIADHA